MAKFIVMDFTKSDIFIEEFDTEEAARHYADDAWDRLTKYDRNRREAFYILESANPDEESEDHFDGEYVKKYK